MNDFYEILKRFLIFYGSTAVSSLLVNKIYYINRIKRSFEKSKRNLKYRDLTLINDRDLKRIKRFCEVEKIGSIFMSIIPFVNIRFTALNTLRNKQEYDDFFNKKIDEINKQELKMRKEFLESMKTEKVIPEDIKKKMEDENYLPNEEEYLKKMKLKKKVKELPVTDFVEPFMKDDKYWYK